MIDLERRFSSGLFLRNLLCKNRTTGKQDDWGVDSDFAHELVAVTPRWLIILELTPEHKGGEHLQPRLSLQGEERTLALPTSI